MAKVLVPFLIALWIRNLRGCNCMCAALAWNFVALVLQYLLNIQTMSLRCLKWFPDEHSGSFSNLPCLWHNHAKTTTDRNMSAKAMPSWIFQPTYSSHTTFSHCPSKHTTPQCHRTLSWKKCSTCLRSPLYASDLTQIVTGGIKIGLGHGVWCCGNGLNMVAVLTYARLRVY